MCIQALTAGGEHAATIGTWIAANELARQRQRAVALTETGRLDQAIPLQAGLAALRADTRRERGLYMTRLARICHEAGVTQQATVWPRTPPGSRRTSQELRRLAGRLRATGHEKPPEDCSP